MTEQKVQARGKIKKGMAPEIVKHFSLPSFAEEVANPYHAYQTYLDLNKAHVLMLAKQGVIAQDVAKQILRVTDDMAKMGDTPAFELDPNREDIYLNIEHYLIEHTSLEIGGQMHTARSRNDLIGSANRLMVRNAFFEVSRLFNGLRKTIIAFARANTDAVMSGYTHIQPSEPITFAHYCSAVLNELERDYRRLANAYAGLNLCPLGAGSMGSTTFPIDRQMTSDLLGFDAPMNNSIDCVASRDYMVEILAALAMASNTFSRFCFDLYLWATPDYGYVEVDDSCAVCSSIMPQKKNPFTLELVKAKAAHIEGFYISVLNAMKNTPFTLQCDIAMEAPHYLWDGFREMTASFEILRATASTLMVKKARMVETAKGNFCTVTELANTLVRRDKISFREAHEIVAMVVDFMITHAKKADEIGHEVIDEIFGRMFGGKTCLTDEEIHAALDPTAIVMAKDVLGGPAPKEVGRQLDCLEAALAADERELEDRQAKVAAAKADMEARLAAFIA